MEQQNNSLNNSQTQKGSVQSWTTREQGFLEILQALARQNDELQQKANSFEQKFNTLEEKMAKVQGDFDNLKEAKDETDKDIRKTRNSTSGYLSIFAALLAFLSVNFTILSKAENGILWICLLFILTGALLLFTSLVLLAGNISSDTKERSNYIYILITIGVIFMLLGGAIGYFNIPSKQQDITQEIDSQLQTDKSS